MITIDEELKVFENDINDVLHIFKPFINNDIKVKIKEIKSGTKVTIIVSLNNFKMQKTYNLIDNQLVDKRKIKGIVKFLLYELLVKFTNKPMPWGSLTGVRPSKLVYDMLDDGLEFEEIEKVLVSDYGLSITKSKTICDVVKNQLKVKPKSNQVDLYIHIPICPSRCSYCSFISSEYERCKKYIDDYVLCLVKELKEVVKLCKIKAFEIKNIYIGGGTPTVLDVKQFKSILDCIDFKFNEFTIECGRADTITKEKLDLFASCGVTRISINPQTLKDETLKIIGRNHTKQDFLNAFELAKNYNFKVNTDLIAGLPNESFEDFKTSLNKIIELSPDNVTVHTMAIKNASLLKLNDTSYTNDSTCEMVEYSYNTLLNSGYKPYYLYRQKNMVGLLENIGYFKNDSICEFNIESMEEMVDIIACGAGAISKRIFKEESRIERSPNVKQIQDYILRIDEMIARKYELFN